MSKTLDQSWIFMLFLVFLCSALTILGYGPPNQPTILSLIQTVLILSLTIIFMCVKLMVEKTDHPYYSDLEFNDRDIKTAFGCSLTTFTLTVLLIAANGIIRTRLSWGEPFVEYGILIMVPMIFLSFQLIRTCSLEKLKVNSTLSKMVFCFFINIALLIARLLFAQDEIFLIIKNGMFICDVLFVVLLTANLINIMIISSRLLWDRFKARSLKTQTTGRISSDTLRKI
jgi:hypothetical protein